MSGEKITYKCFPAKTFIIKEGETLDYAYLIKEGTVEVFRKVGKCELKSLTKLGPGQIIGEMSLFGSKISTAYVKAHTDVELQLISKAVFKEYLDQTPPLIKLLLEILVQRLNKTSQMYLNSDSEPSLAEQIRRRPTEIDLKTGKIKSRQDSDS